MSLDDVEARGYQLVAEITRRPLVCRDDRMIELLDDVAIEEADQQGASRAEYAAEFQERCADCVWLMVDQRVPSEHSTNCPGPDIKGVEAACPERNAGIGTAGLLDELGNQVHSECRNPNFMEKICPLARTATGVQYRTFDTVRPSRHELTIRGVHSTH